MSVLVNDVWFYIRDKVSWQLLGMERESLEMHGELTAIRITPPVIGVAKDTNGQHWLLDLADVKNESPFRGVDSNPKSVTLLPRGPFDPVLTEPAQKKWDKEK